MNYLEDFLRGLKTVIYLRKSRVDLEEEMKAVLRGEEYDTLEKHRKELLRFAKERGLIIVDIYEEVVSGDTVEARSEIKKLLANVEAEKYDCALVVALDRLSRGDKSDQGYIENIFKKSDTLIVTPSKIYDLNSEEGEQSADIDGFIARIEFRRIKKRLEDGKKRSAYEGKNVSNKVLFGFSKDDGTKKLIIDENEAPTVRLIYQLIIEGNGAARIAKKLHYMGITTRKGNDFSEKTVRDIVKNPKYKGDQFYAVTRHGRKTMSPIYVENAHEAIVDAETWRLANDMLVRRRPKINTNSKIANPFASIMKCGNCGKSIRSNVSRGKRYLHCNSIDCSTRGSLLVDVEAKFLESIASTLAAVNVEVDFEENNDLLNELYRLEQDADKTIENLREQINTAHTLLEQKVYTPEVFLARTKILNDEIENQMSRKQNIIQRREEELQKYDNMNNLAPKIVNALEVYYDATPEEKNELIKSFVRKIVYKKEKEDCLIQDFTLDIFFD